MDKRFTLLILMLVVFLSACSQASTEQGIRVKEPWARAASAMMGHGQSTETGQENSGSGMMANGAAYMVIENQGGASDKLLSVSSDVAQFIEVHKTEMQDGVMRMMPVEFIEIPANSRVELKPGGFHIMLIGLKRDLVPGDEINLILNFEIAGEVPVIAKVRAP